MEIPTKVEKLVKRYFNLQIGEQRLRTPYYINKKHARGGELRSLVGKGTPTEIEEEVRIFAKLRGFDIEKATTEEIREFMKSEGIGIDCSGFVSHILDIWLKSSGQKGLYANLQFENKNFMDSLIKYLRPIQNISANLLTNETNSIPIRLEDVQAGDLIRLKGLEHGHHIAIISQVMQDENNREIEYLHSTPHYGQESGVRKGQILITDDTKDLAEQTWKEVDEDGICWTLKQYLKNQEDNGIRRSKFFVI